MTVGPGVLCYSEGKKAMNGEGSPAGVQSVPGEFGAKDNTIHSFIKLKAPGPSGADHTGETGDTGLDLRSSRYMRETDVKPVTRKLICSYW